jgi:hypothetical protein
LRENSAKGGWGKLKDLSAEAGAFFQRTQGAFLSRGRRQKFLFKII